MKHELGLPFPPKNLHIKFGTNSSTIFLVIVVTDGHTWQTDTQTNASKNTLPRFHGENKFWTCSKMQVCEISCGRSTFCWVSVLYSTLMVCEWCCMYILYAGITIRAVKLTYGVYFSALTLLVEWQGLLAHKKTCATYTWRLSSWTSGGSKWKGNNWPRFTNNQLWKWLNN